MIEKCCKMKIEMMENNKNVNKEMNRTKTKIYKERKEQQKNFDELNETINNLIEITKIEFKKEIKEYQEEIEKIKKEKEQFINEIMNLEIDLIGKKYNVKKEQKIQIENWTNLK